EVHMDKIAHDLCLDPVEFRRRNLIEPYTRTVNGLRITSCALGECLDAVAEHSGWNKLHSASLNGKGAMNGSHVDDQLSTDANGADAINREDTINRPPTALTVSE